MDGWSDRWCGQNATGQNVTGQNVTDKCHWTKYKMRQDKISCRQNVTAQDKMSLRQNATWQNAPLKNVTQTNVSYWNAIGKIPLSPAFWSMPLCTKPPLFGHEPSGLVYSAMNEIIRGLEFRLTFVFAGFRLYEFSMLRNHGYVQPLWFL